MNESVPQLRIHAAPAAERTPIGICAIGTHRPERTLPNAWFSDLMAKKFVKHTGIYQRAVSDVDEIELAERSIQQLYDELTPQTSASQNHPLTHCRGLVFVCPSVIPQSVARRLLPKDRARAEQPNRMARQLVEKLQAICPEFRPRRVRGMNGFCSGYAKALQHVQHRMLDELELQREESILVVTSNCISRITDFGDRQSGALFGDFATATLLARVDSSRHTVRLELRDAHFARRSTNRAYFDFHASEQTLFPFGSKNERCIEDRIVFSLDGMGIADTAPRAMAHAAATMIEDNCLEASDIDTIVPHQAGQGIVRLTGMKLEEAGFNAEVINGLTAETGNISSGSVPFALKENWHNLSGNILCPVAAVGAPGKAEVSQGCILLRAPKTALPSKAAA